MGSKKGSTKQEPVASEDATMPTDPHDRDRERTPPGQRDKKAKKDAVAAGSAEVHEVPDDDAMSADESEAEEEEQATAEGADLHEWRAVSREQLLSGMAAMLPSLVDKHIMTLIEPLKADLGEIKKRQVASDKVVSRLSKEVNALRVTGQATQDKVSELSNQIANLTKAMEAMNTAKSDSAAAPASSASAMPAPRRSHAEQHSISTPRSSAQDYKDSGGKEPEAIRTKLVSWPYKVHGEHMRTIYARLQQERMDDEMRKGAFHNVPTSGTRFGIVFATRAHATKFSDNMRSDPFVYEPIGTAIKVTLRVAPPKDADTKAKGQLLSKVFRSIDVGTYRGRPRPSYPRVGDPRAELAIPLPSGELRDIAIVRFQEINDEWRIKTIEVAEEIFRDCKIVNELIDETGVRPQKIATRNGQQVETEAASAPPSS